MTVKRPAADAPRCIVIAGPNGAGKTTFAREFLPKDTDVVHFVNADLIAGGLSALKPELVGMSAGRVFLAELDRLARGGTSFAFETTFSGRVYASRLLNWKRAGYRIEMVYLKISSFELARKRIAARVRQGGHDVPKVDVIRRFSRSWVNFINVYQPLADIWSVYDNSGETPQMLETKP